MKAKVFISKDKFEFESGGSLSEVQIAYHTYGKLNENKDNVIWVFHALTANSDCKNWWGVLFGEGNVLDESKHFIVCANILGSCYGSSGPLSIDPITGEPYYHSFPKVSIRDMVKAHILLATHLGINKIKLGIGGSMGGYQLLEWSVMSPETFQSLALLTTSARESAWGIAIHTTQRMAIENDVTWKDSFPEAGKNGMMVARAVGMLTYRGYRAFNATQMDNDDRLDEFSASSYILYQGEKLAKRFNAYSYWLLTKAMDTHNIARGRKGTLEEVLTSIKENTIVIGISSDMLCPVSEQEFIAKSLPNAKYIEIESEFGHDGFLVEGEKIKKQILPFLESLS